MANYFSLQETNEPDCYGITDPALAQQCAAALAQLVYIDGKAYRPVQGAAFTLPNITKTGHTCRWARGSSNGSQSSGGSQVTITSNTTFYAKCEMLTYTTDDYCVQFDPGSNYTCHYKRVIRSSDGGYWCIDRSTYEQMGGLYHGGAAVSNNSYGYYCCPNKHGDLSLYGYGQYSTECNYRYSE